MNTPAVTINTKNAVLGFGPTCARIMGLFTGLASLKKRPRKQLKHCQHEQQIDLFEGLQ